MPARAVFYRAASPAVFARSESRLGDQNERCAFRVPEPATAE
jgi:hypothetical protein